MKRPLFALMLTPALLAAAPGDAAAAESYDSCRGFINNLPAVINTPGVWCLRADLFTSMTSGAAITIAASNVTIDCNHFRLVGHGAGNTSQAQGIMANFRQNATVRNCAISGFRDGISLEGSTGSGHLVADNRLDGNLVRGINVAGSGNLVTRNWVIDTGGAASPQLTVGIIADADIIDNTVDGVFTTSGSVSVRGISSQAKSVEIRGNRVRNLFPNNTGVATGITSFGAGAAVMENRIVSGRTGPNDRGISFANTTPQPFCGLNTISGFTRTIVGTCTFAGANATN